MNRAILIVICDFLVSAMLSMMTGMVPAHTGGTGVGLDEETTRTMLAEMNATRAELERMRERLREAVRLAGSATPEQERQLRELAARIVDLRRNAELVGKNNDAQKLAKLSAEELAKRVEAEIRRRMEAELDLKGEKEDREAAEKELRGIRRDFAETSRAMADLSKHDAETRRKLESSRQDLGKAEKELADVKSKLQSAGAELASGRREIQRRNAELAEVRETLREMNARLGRSSAETGSLRQSLAYTSGKLDSAEREAAESADKLSRLRREHSVTILERDEARRKQTELERLVKSTVNELSQTRKSAEEVRLRNAEVTGKLAAATEQLTELKRRLENHVLQCYGSGAVKVEVAVTEDGLVTERRGGGTYYLPLVEAGGRTYIVGHLRQFAGDLKVSLGYTRIKSAGMKFSAPGSEAAAQSAEAILIDRDEPCAAAVEAAVPGRTPIKALTPEELRARGIKNLYLFKSDFFGKESAELDGRCTLDATGGSPYLIVRNSGSRSELKAEPGDFVLTQEGDFVGVVTDVYARGFGRGYEARVFVLPGRESWQNARRIPYGKAKDAKYCEEFASAVRAARAEAEKKAR